MKYMLMMNHPGKTAYQIFKWPEADIKAHIGFMIALNKKLPQAVNWCRAKAWQAPDQARLVRASDNGTPITDGVFPKQGIPGRLLDRRRVVAGNAPMQSRPKHRQRQLPAASR